MIFQASRRTGEGRNEEGAAKEMAADWKMGLAQLITRVALMTLMVGMLVCCGGGGGGGGPTSADISTDNAGGWPVATIGPNATVNGTLQSSDIHWPDGTSADFYAVTLSSAATLTITMDSAAFDAYLFLFKQSALNDANPDNWFTSSWLAEDDDSGGETNASISIALSAGTYLIVANSFDVGETGAYTLTTSSTNTSGGAGVLIELSSDAVNFQFATGGPSPAAQTLTVSFSGDGLIIGYPPGTEQPDWLTVEQTDTSDTTSPVDIQLSVNTTSLPAGTYQTTVRLLTGTLDGTDVSYKDLAVTCVAADQMSLDKSELNFSFVNGSAGGAGNQSVSVNGNAIAWTASSDQDWVVLSATSGTSPSTLDIGIDPAGLTSGTYTATVTVSDSSSGVSETLAVNLAVEPHKLFVGDNGVAFSSFPTAPSALTHTVTVADNIGVATSWTASSDQTWLEVTASGMTDGSLTVTADPTGLATDTTHYATVTVNSTDPTIENAETVTVGFYVAGSDPTASQVSSTGLHIVADPIRPYVYVTSGTSGVDIYHIYTGDKIATIAAGTDLEAMTVSSDGKTLFVLDANDNSIVPVDLDTQSSGTKWLAGCSYNGFASLEFTRFNGMGVVLTSHNEVIAEADGTQVATLPTDSPDACWDNVVLAASQEGNDFFSVEPWVSGALDLNRFTGEYSTAKDTYSVTKTHSLNRTFANVQDIAVNQDGSKIYTAAGGEYHFPTFLFDGSSIVESTTLAGNPYPNAVEVGPTDKMYGGIDAFGSGDDVLSYNADNSTDSAYFLSGSLRNRQLRISGDGLRMITLSGSSVLTFTAVTP